MKKPLFIILILFINAALFAQSPKSFKYQALLRDKNGVLIIDKNVSVRISILQETISGTSVYSEVHPAKTSTSGTINLEIGKGNQSAGNFATINWGQNSFFVKIEMDPAGGSAFELVGTSQLLSVPYALYAEKSGDEKWSKNSTSNPDIYFNSGDVGIGVSDPQYKLDVNGTVNATSFSLNGQPFTNTWSTLNNNTFYSLGKVGIGTSAPQSNLDIQGLNSTSGLYKTQFKGTESEGKGRLDIRNDPSDLSNVYSTSINRFGDTSEDLLFGLQQPLGNTTSWNILESWRGAGLLVSASGPDLAPLVFGIDRVEKARLNTDGNFGIGTISPQYKLDVNGAINATSLLINGQPISGGSSSWSTLNNNTFYSLGKVGIGTSAPQSTFDIQGLNSTSGLYKTQFKGTESEGKGRLDIRNDPSDLSNVYSTSINRLGDTSEDLLFGLQQPIGNTTSWNIFESWRGAGLMISASGPDLAPLVFGIDRVEKARLSTTGNLGIGTTDPKSKLQVENGDIYINSITSGVIMKSPNGQCWRMTISNTGVPVTSSVTCP